MLYTNPYERQLKLYERQQNSSYNIKTNPYESLSTPVVQQDSFNKPSQESKPLGSPYERQSYYERLPNPLRLSVQLDQSLDPYARLPPKSEASRNPYDRSSYIDRLPQKSDVSRNPYDRSSYVDRLPNPQRLSLVNLPNLLNQKFQNQQNQQYERFPSKNPYEQLSPKPESNIYDRGSKTASSSNLYERVKSDSSSNLYERHSRTNSSSNPYERLSKTDSSNPYERLSKTDSSSNLYERHSRTNSASNLYERQSPKPVAYPHEKPSPRVPESSNLYERQSPKPTTSSNPYERHSPKTASSNPYEKPSPRVSESSNPYERQSPKATASNPYERQSYKADSLKSNSLKSNPYEKQSTKSNSTAEPLGIPYERHSYQKLPKTRPYTEQQLPNPDSLLSFAKETEKPKPKQLNPYDKLPIILLPKSQLSPFPVQLPRKLLNPYDDVKKSALSSPKQNQDMFLKYNSPKVIIKDDPVIPDYPIQETFKKNSKYNMKIVVVGDGGCGKTCLLVSYAQNKFPEIYVPTVFENYVTNVLTPGNDTIELALWDTAGQEEYERLRPLSYPNVDVLLVCFALDSIVSLQNIKDIWFPEVSYFCPGIPIVLVGTKSDLNSSMDPDLPIQLATEINAIGYVQCLAKHMFNIRTVFNFAIDHYLKQQQINEQIEKSQKNRLSRHFGAGHSRNQSSILHRRAASGHLKTSSYDSAFLLDQPLAEDTYKANPYGKFDNHRYQDDDLAFAREDRSKKKKKCTIF